MDAIAEKLVTYISETNYDGLPQKMLLMRQRNLSLTPLVLALLAQGSQAVKRR